MQSPASFFNAAAKFCLTFDNPSVRICFAYWRRTSEGDSLVPVYPGRTPALIHPKLFRICRSKPGILQVLYKQHLQDRSAQTLHQQHLRHLLGSLATKGLITPLGLCTFARCLREESALPDKHRVLPVFSCHRPPSSPLETTLTRMLTSVHSKRLTGSLSPLESAFTKNTRESTASVIVN